MKPSCFQCKRADRANECEYDDGTTKTVTQLLYEKLHRLEKRLRELQAQQKSPLNANGSGSSTNSRRTSSISSTPRARPALVPRSTTGRDVATATASGQPRASTDSYLGPSVSTASSSLDFYPGSDFAIASTMLNAMSVASDGHMGHLPVGFNDQQSNFRSHGQVGNFPMGSATPVTNGAIPPYIAFGPDLMGMSSSVDSFYDPSMAHGSLVKDTLPKS